MTKEMNSDKFFNGILGQELAISLLNSALYKRQIAPGYLFSGAKGIGKKLTAMRFIEGLTSISSQGKSETKRIDLSNHPDLMKVEPTYLHKGKLISKSSAEKETIGKKSLPIIRLEQIKEVSRFLGKNPVESEKGIVLIDEAETMNEAAANALLKTLEEPGKGALILISERPEKLLPTICSRCQKIPFLRLNDNSLKEVLTQLQFTEDNNYNYIDQKELINLANGSPGQFIQNIKSFNAIPKEIWKRLTELPKEPIEALSLAKDINDLLDVEEQIWLINFYQLYKWNKSHNSKAIKKLEVLRSQLTSYVQPRLAWEVALLSLIQISKR